MKKKYLCITGILMSLYLYGYHTIPEYQIQMSISIGNRSERQTMLKVIVYRNHFDKELPREIEQFFVDLNGAPTTLQIELYFDGHQHPYKTVSFDY
ncbi:MAG: hypothetical protein HFG70_13615 [Hungatella sp.]|nr:hypothetical protein [Hungatella sp.]